MNVALNLFGSWYHFVYILYVSPHDYFLVFDNASDKKRMEI